ncbi:MAG: hypothetical protein ACE5GV_05960 [Candidatus Scalindua sp.]
MNKESKDIKTARDRVVKSSGLLCVGDIVRLSGCPYDEQIPEEMEKFSQLFNIKQTVIEIKDVSGEEGSTGQWVKTDKEPNWIDKAWYYKDT